MNFCLGCDFLGVNIKLGNRIKKIRLSLGKTQGEFGLLFNPPAPKSAVSRWEHGGSPNKKRLREIAEIGHVPVSYLTGTDKLVQSLNESVDKIVGAEEQKSLARYSQILQTCLEVFNEKDRKHLEELQKKLQNKSDNTEKFQEFEYLISELLGVFLYTEADNNKQAKKAKEAYNSVKNIIETATDNLPEFNVSPISPKK